MKAFAVKSNPNESNRSSPLYSDTSPLWWVFSAPKVTWLEFEARSFAARLHGATIGSQGTWRKVSHLSTSLFRVITLPFADQLWCYVTK